MLNNRQIGAKGELIAKKHIEDLGYDVLQSNYRTKIGEIDIIAVYEDVIVFLEVKLRKTLRYGYPIEAICTRKMKTIRLVAHEYIKSKSLWDYSIRFDVVEVFLNEKDAFKVNLIKNAF